MFRAERLRRFFRRLLRVELRRPQAIVALAYMAGIWPATGCISAPQGRARLDDVVIELNQAARFGRSDVAFELVSPSSRASYAVRHRGWGTALRVVDVDFAGTEKMSANEAVVLVAYHWFRPGENTLHTTSVRQTWRTDAKAGAWTLIDEQRASGDLGLLGDAPPKEPTSQADHDATASKLDAVAPRHFPTTIIR